jgi:hypothetical protein
MSGEIASFFAMIINFFHTLYDALVLEHFYEFMFFLSWIIMLEASVVLAGFYWGYGVIFATLYVVFNGLFWAAWYVRRWLK